MTIIAMITITTTNTTNTTTKLPSTPHPIPFPNPCSLAARATHVARDRALSHQSDTASNRKLVRKQPTRKRRNETRTKRHHENTPPPTSLPQPLLSPTTQKKKPILLEAFQSSTPLSLYFPFFFFWAKLGLTRTSLSLVNDGVFHESGTRKRRGRGGRR